MPKKCEQEDCAYYAEADEYGCARGAALDYEACFETEKETIKCPHCGKPVPVTVR